MSLGFNSSGSIMPKLCWNNIGRQQYVSVAGAEFARAAKSGLAEGGFLKICWWPDSCKRVWHKTKDVVCVIKRGSAAVGWFRWLEDIDKDYMDWGQDRCVYIESWRDARLD